ncbi:MAG: DUF4296 domain-containing protein [Chitinophagales bacterium]
MNLLISKWLRIVTLFIVFIYCACASEIEKAPEGILSKDKMIAVLLDVHIAESSVNSRGMTNQQLNQNVAAKYEDVMKKNGTTFDTFKKSFDYYLHHPEQYEEIYLEIVNKLTALEGKAKAKELVLKKEGVDSIPGHAGVVNDTVLRKENQLAK